MIDWRPILELAATLVLVCGGTIAIATVFDWLERRQERRRREWWGRGL